MDRKIVNFIKEQYPPGTRIRLNSMEDPYHPILPGTEGEVDFVDDKGQIFMKWDNGRTLPLAPGEDSFTVLPPKLTTLKLYSIATRMGELVFFAIKPTNISVLPDAGVGARIYALLNVVKGMAEIEMLALNSKESFENNKAFYRQRANEEELPVIRKLLEQDSKHLDRIQVLMASSREFYILVRLQGKKESDVFSYLSRIEKSIKDNGFTVRRAAEEDLKRMLGVYFEQNVTTERYEDHDGERWVLFGE